MKADDQAMTAEYRAMYEYPYAHGRDAPYGPWRTSLAEVKEKDDRAPRSEENHGYLSGFQVRWVTKPIFTEEEV